MQETIRQYAGAEEEQGHESAQTRGTAQSLGSREPKNLMRVYVPL